MKEELNDKKILFVFFIMLGITIFLFFGVAYAFFTYSKEGTKNVTMTSGSVKLHYEESSLKSINLTNALPMDDERGKAQTDYFEFTITSETAGYDIPYYVTSRVTTEAENQIPASYISLYLTEVVNNSEQEVLDTTYDELTNVSKNNHVEQQLMNNTVATNTANYEKTYRLRIWINETADYSPTEVGGEQVYPMQDKSFNFIINVYTEVETVASCQPDSIGDKYCFGTECFNVVTSDCDETVLLADYNLDAFGDYYREPTYKQLSATLVDGASSGMFTTKFSDSIYWYEGEYPVDPDETPDPSESPDPSSSPNPNVTVYPYVYDLDASPMTTDDLYTITEHYGYSGEYYSCYTSYGKCIPHYLEDYLLMLKGASYGVPQSANIRLLSKEEGNLIVNRYDLLNNQPFWLGSAKSYNKVWYFQNYNAYNPSFVLTAVEADTNQEEAGIRPTLVIPTSDLPVDKKVN